MYLHFDQTAYFLKETIWFNAYILDESNRPTDISRVLYVELVSPEGGIVDTFKGKIENGTCHGQFALDSAYLSGYFEIRAYTRHMMNFGEDNYFSRVFPIYDIATDGNYHIRSMLDRLRPDLSKDNNLTFRERQESPQRTHCLCPYKKLSIPSYGTITISPPTPLHAKAYQKTYDREKKWNLYSGLHPIANFPFPFVRKKVLSTRTIKVTFTKPCSKTTVG